MSVATNRAPSLESEAAVRSILALLVEDRAGREPAEPILARAGLSDAQIEAVTGRDAAPAREYSVIDRARDTLIARQAFTR